MLFFIFLISLFYNQVAIWVAANRRESETIMISYFMGFQDFTYLRWLLVWCSVSHGLSATLLMKGSIHLKRPGLSVFVRYGTKSLIPSAAIQVVQHMFTVIQLQQLPSGKARRNFSFRLCRDRTWEGNPLYCCSIRHDVRITGSDRFIILCRAWATR